MGTDCTAVIEKEGDSWTTIGVMYIPRNYELYHDIQSNAFIGYPPDADTLSQDILDAVEDWGECWTSYNTFLDFLAKYDMEDLDTIKKKYRDKCRVIYRFDN